MAVNVLLCELLPDLCWTCDAHPLSVSVVECASKCNSCWADVWACSGSDSVVRVVTVRLPSIEIYSDKAETDKQSELHIMGGLLGATHPHIKMTPDT